MRNNDFINQQTYNNIKSKKQNTLTAYLKIVSTIDSNIYFYVLVQYLVFNPALMSSEYNYEFKMLFSITENGMLYILRETLINFLNTSKNLLFLYCLTRAENV